MSNLEKIPESLPSKSKTGTETIQSPRRRRMAKPVGWVVFGLSLLIAGAAVGYFAAGRQPASATDKSTAEAKTAKSTSEPTVWTCSMHPEIKLPKPGKCPKCFMPLIPLVKESGEDMGPRQLKLSESAIGLAEIRTAPVRRQYVTNDVRLVGKVDYDETKVANITAWVPGRLDRLFVDFTGISVRKGDHLVNLFSPDLIVAQRELLQMYAAHKKLNGSALNFTASTLRSAEEKLRLLGVLPEQIEEIKRQGKPSDHLTIYAPIGGIVIEKLANEGMYVQTGTRIYTIADLSLVWVYLDAYESDVAWLRYGQQVEFTTETYPGEIFKGRIAFIDPMLNEDTRTVRVRVNVPNADERLKPGMFVRARVRSRLASGGKVFDDSLVGKWISPMHPEIVKDGPGKCDICGMDLVPAEQLGYAVPQAAPERPLVIPATAPLITGKRAVVYVRLPDKKEPTFEGREILLGERAGNSYVVRYGLEEGELVVVNGNFKIDSALQIQAKPSMMNPAADAMPAEADDGEAKHEKHTIAVPSAFRVQLNPLYQDYLDAVSALANDDLGAARTALLKMPAALLDIDSSVLDDMGVMHWKPLSSVIAMSAYEAGEAKTRDDARRHLGALSTAMTRVIDTFGHALEGPVYRVHCPMALDAKGADWLQTSDSVRNPYYGRAMLECGDRTATYESQAPLTVPESFRRQLGGIYSAYLQLHAALADDRVNNAKTALGKLKTAVAAPDASVLKGRVLHTWQAAQSELTNALAGDWQADDLEALRGRFASVSNTVLAIVDALGHSGKVTLHRAFCPMAFDNKGAAWLQADKDVLNPYFGQKMLGCGELQRDFPPANASASTTDGKGDRHE